MICWVVTDGNAGAKSQALGLAESLGIKFVEKKFKLINSLRIFAPYIPFNYLTFKTKDSDDIDINHPPQILIVCGSKARSIGPLFKRKYGDKIFTIYIQDPKISPEYYDLIISPKHDNIHGPNVIKTNFALNRVNQEKLKNELEKYKHLFTKYPKPYNSILIGGDTKSYKMDNTACKHLLQNVEYIAKKSPGSLLITTSRRTPKSIIQSLQKLAESNDKVFLCTPDSPENPFFAMLKIADNIFVTNDSVSMVSESCAAGKPIYVIPLLGHQNNKVSLMFENLVKDKQIFSLSDYDKNTKVILKSKSETLIIAKKVEDMLSSQGFKIK